MIRTVTHRSTLVSASLKVDVPRLPDCCLRFFSRLPRPPQLTRYFHVTYVLSSLLKVLPPPEPTHRSLQSLLVRSGFLVTPPSGAPPHVKILSIFFISQSDLGLVMTLTHFLTPWASGSLICKKGSSVLSYV